MKTIFALLAAGAMLTGCVAVPVEPGPVIYAAPPPPAVVVAPRPYYYRGGYHYRGGPYWRRGWR